MQKGFSRCLLSALALPLISLPAVATAAEDVLLDAEFSDIEVGGQKKVSNPALICVE